MRKMDVCNECTKMSNTFVPHLNFGVFLLVKLMQTTGYTNYAQ